MKGCFGLATVVAFVACIFAYFHSLIFSINHLGDKPYEWLVLIGSVLPPLGVIHGILLWLGAVTQ